MAMSFAFWWVAGYFLGGDKYAPAIIGMTITGVRGVVASDALRFTAGEEAARRFAALIWYWVQNLHLLCDKQKH